MALITCPDCGKQVSDLASSCPHCGHPFIDKRKQSLSSKLDSLFEDDSQEDDQNSKQNGSSNGLFTKIIIGILVVGVIGAAIDDLTGSNKDKSNQQEEQKTETKIANPAIEEPAQLSKEERSKSSVMSKFKGTYSFEKYGSDDGRFVLLEDGRFLSVATTLGGDTEKEYISNIVIISENAFMLKRTPSTEGYAGKRRFWIVEAKMYRGNEIVGHQSEFTTDGTIFDVSECKMYRDKGDYDNRDVITPEYFRFTHSL